MKQCRFCSCDWGQEGTRGIDENCPLHGVASLTGEQRDRRKYMLIERSYGMLLVGLGYPLALAFTLVVLSSQIRWPWWVVGLSFIIGGCWLVFWILYGFRCVDRAYLRPEC